MPICRIYLFAYKRNNLLPRAVKSLLDQTFTNWICEVHNDCPDDHYPEQYIASLNDERFTMHNHLLNFGAVVSFNLAFAGCDEEYASLLEDDNWWEPTFLEEMINFMNEKPSLNISWSNMRIWREKPDNIWQDTGKTTWPIKKEKSIFFQWPNLLQAMNALHSNGAMIYRSKYAQNYQVPNDILFNAIELIRERTFEHPICLLNKPLANFSITLFTNRSDDASKWTASQVMMLASFIATSPDCKKAFNDCLIYYRKQKPKPVVNFFLANIFLLKKPSLYKLFNLSDWIFFSKWLIINNYKLKHIRHYLLSKTLVFQFLLKNTSIRFKESKQNSKN